MLATLPQLQARVKAMVLISTSSRLLKAWATIWPIDTLEPTLEGPISKDPTVAQTMRELIKTISFLSQVEAEMAISITRVEEIVEVIIIKVPLTRATIVDIKTS